MKFHPIKPQVPPPFSGSVARRLGAAAASLVLVALAALSLASSAQAATAVGLGTLDSFGVLGGSGVTNTGPTVVNGDLGTAPTPAVTGFGGAPDGTVNGSIHQADAVAAQAQADLTTAYNDAAGQGPVNTIGNQLAGQSLTPGVYGSASGTFDLSGPLTLNAGGDPSAVFIFQTATTLVTASASSVNLINGAQACNVFWQVGSSATLGTSSFFAGNILAAQSISAGNGVTVDGRLLARGGAVTLDSDTITRAQCAATGGGGPGPVPPPPGGDDGGGDDGGGGGNGGGNGGGGNGGGGNGGGGNGNGGPNGNGPNGNGGPSVSITGFPNGPPETSDRCIDRGFRAHIRITDRVQMRRVQVFLAGELLFTSRRKDFYVWIPGAGLRTGKNTIKVVAVDRAGRREVERRSFDRCAPAVPSPAFTG